MNCFYQLFHHHSHLEMSTEFPYMFIFILINYFITFVLHTVLYNMIISDGFDSCWSQMISYGNP